jgi:hypothetical protein
MIVRRLATGLLLSSVLALTGCFEHCDRCHEQPRAACCPPPASPCCPPSGGVVPAPGTTTAPPSQFYYGPAPFGR